MRKLTILTLALLYVVSLAVVSVFAANAASDDKIKAHMVPIESRWFPLTDGGTETSASAISGKSNTSPNQALGYYMSPGHVLGTTTYDLQHNMRMARQVEVGGDGRVHFVWTSAPFPFDAGLRAAWYTAYNPTTGIFAPEAFSVSAQVEKVPGRFCTVDVFSNRALAVNHATTGGGNKTTSALDIGSGSGTFTGIDTPSDIVNCEGIYTAGGAVGTFQRYIWPVAAADKDGSGKLVIHVVASEGITGAGPSSIVYFRGVSSGVTMDPGMYGTCGTFIDSSNATGYDVAADPYSNRVVIVYPLNRGGTGRSNGDVAYRLSDSLGVSWGPRVNVTNYHTSYKERAEGDMNVLFTADGYFHILYVTTIQDSVAGTISDPESKLWHWSSANPVGNGLNVGANFYRSLVLDANNADAACNTPAFEYNVCKVTLSQCISTALSDTLLYAVYSRQLGSDLLPDCSDLNYYNQEVFFSPSSTWGETWGEPVNLTNTRTDGCVAPNCADDGSASSARYVRDSLRIEYMQDLDAGSQVGNESGTASLLNPIIFISTPCIAMAPYRIMTCTPNKIVYPFYAKPGATASQSLLLTNGGNMAIPWNASVSGAVPIGLAPSSGSVPAGLSNSATVTATVGPMATEGLHKGTITFTYDGGAKTFDVPVDFYVFNVWFLPQDVAIRTSTNRLAVNQAGQVANDISTSSFSYFAKPADDFITDGSLILGNSKDNLSWLIFKGGQGGPTPSNDFGKLYALSNIKVDSTTYDNEHGYTIACGNGTNRDSTVAFDVQWYAPHHTDSADFYIGHFEIYKGVNNPTGTVTGLTVAFTTDFDVPSDTSSDNTIGIDDTRQMISLQGEYSAARQQGYAALAASRDDAVPITGGFAWGNQQQVYALGGYSVDSVWKYMNAILPPPNNFNSPWSDGDSIGDMSLVMVIAKNYTVTPTSRLAFNVVLAAKLASANTEGLGGLNTAVDKARAFSTSWHPATALCPSCEDCGNANDDDAIDIADAVFLINYIFKSGKAPDDCISLNGKGNANGDDAVDIADAVFLINYIFKSGKEPCCSGPCP